MMQSLETTWKKNNLWYVDCFIPVWTAILTDGYGVHQKLITTWDIMMMRKGKQMLQIPQESHSVVLKWSRWRGLKS
jgi:hypothetical protein